METNQPLKIFRTPEAQRQFQLAYADALKLWPVPYEERFVSTRFGDTHVVISGAEDGDPLVLFHGSGGGATIWHRNVRPLSRRCRVFAVDTLTEPNPSCPTRPIRGQREFADWIADLLDGLGVQCASLVGNSFGGFMALTAALFLPERVKKVILISPAATFDPMIALWVNLLIPAHVIAPLIGSKTMVQRGYDWLWQDFPVDECVARLRRLTSLYGTLRHSPPVVFTDEQLRRIQAPVLLLIGDREVIYSPERVIRRAARLVPDLKAEIVPNANHCAQYTAADLVNRKILEFLAIEKVH